MKNLPEHQMEELRNRLRNYTERPDDSTWDKIAVALPPHSPGGWIKPVALTSLFLLYSSVMWLAGRYSNSDQSAGFVQVEKKAVVPATDSCGIEKAGHTLTDSNQRVSSRPPAFDPLTSLGTTRTQSWSRNADGLGVTKLDPQQAASPAEDRLTHDQTSSTAAANGLDAMDSSQSENKILDQADSVPKDVTASEVPVIIEKAKKTHAKPVLYFQIAPSLSYQKIVPFQNDGTFITKLNSKSIFSGDRAGFSADAGLQWRLSERLDLYSGLSYHQENGVISFSYQSGDVKTEEKQGTGLNYVLTPLATTNSFRFTMKNVGASAGILYLLQDAGLRHKIGAGFQYQVGLSGDGKDARYQNGGSSYLNYQILYRIEFPLDPKYTFFIQPAFTHSLMVKEKLDAPFDVKHYNASLGFGLTYRF